MPIHSRDDGSTFRVTMEGRVTEEEFRAYHGTLLERMRTQRGRGGKFAVLGDARHALPLDSALRRRLAVFMAEHDALSRKTIAGSAWVISSPLQRGVLAAITWLRTPPIPIRAFDTMDEAEAAVRAFLAESRAVDRHAASLATERDADDDPSSRES